ncbi:MAG: glycoside hydrolase family 3 N-terminal domain-containing protein [Solirubrobacterales bacterium]
MAALAALAGALVGAGAGEERPPTSSQAAIPEACQGAGGEAWGRLAGQRIVVRTDGTPDSALLRRARSGQIAGVIVFPAVGVEQPRIEEGIKGLQRAAKAGGHPPLVVATDQEGGPVKRFPADPPLRSPYSLGETGDPADARLEGAATGNFLRGLGINTDLAPVLDVPASAEAVISLRAFGTDAERVSALGLAFADGLAQERVLATAKHFPGLGQSVLNTDFSPSEIEASRGDLREDLAPFRDAIAREVPLIMVGNASYPALGADGPAALQAAIAQRLLRERLGFEGVSISDDLQAGALEAAYDSVEAAERAARAGVDLLLFAGDSAPDVYERLSRALDRGTLDAAAARESCVRVVELRESLR